MTLTGTRARKPHRRLQQSPSRQQCPNLQDPVTMHQGKSLYCPPRAAGKFRAGRPDGISVFLNSGTKGRDPEIFKPSRERSWRSRPRRERRQFLRHFHKQHATVPEGQRNTTHYSVFTAPCDAADMTESDDPRQIYGSSPGSIASPRTSRATGVMLRNSRNSPGGQPAMCGRVFLPRRR